MLTVFSLEACLEYSRFPDKAFLDYIPCFLVRLCNKTLKIREIMIISCAMSPISPNEKAKLTPDQEKPKKKQRNKTKVERFYGL